MLIEYMMMDLNNMSRWTPVYSHSKGPFKYRCGWPTCAMIVETDYVSCIRWCTSPNSIDNIIRYDACCARHSDTDHRMLSFDEMVSKESVVNADEWFVALPEVEYIHEGYYVPMRFRHFKPEDVSLGPFDFVCALDECDRLVHCDRVGDIQWHEFHNAPFRRFGGACSEHATLGIRFQENPEKKPEKHIIEVKCSVQGCNDVAYCYEEGTKLDPHIAKIILSATADGRAMCPLHIREYQEWDLENGRKEFYHHYLDHLYKLAESFNNIQSIRTEQQAKAAHNRMRMLCTHDLKR